MTQQSFSYNQSLDTAQFPPYTIVTFNSNDTLMDLEVIDPGVIQGTIPLFIRCDLEESDKITVRMPGSGNRTQILPMTR